MGKVNWLNVAEPIRDKRLLLNTKSSRISDTYLIDFGRLSQLQSHFTVHGFEPKVQTASFVINIASTFKKVKNVSS